MTDQHFATDPSQLAPQDLVLSMSGLDFMRAMLSGRVAAPPISLHLNFRLHEVSEGRVGFRGTPPFEVSNPMGVVHGGWYGALLDSCMGCAVMTTVPQGSLYTTLEFKVNITRTIPPDTEVEAVGQVQHSGRSTGIASGEIRGIEDGKLYATGSTTCIIMNRG